MQLTKKQLTELLNNYLIEKDLNSLLEVVLDSLMYSERQDFLNQSSDNKGNGYRLGQVFGYGAELSLRIPRDRQSAFYPVILALFRSQEIHLKEIAFLLYSKGLTTRDVEGIIDSFYGKHYSKSSISNISKSFFEQMEIWRNRPLSSHYLAFYIDGLFVKLKRDNQYKEECFYIVLGLKEDYTREIVAIVNQPTESALSWEYIFSDLKARGLESVGLVVSDALTGIEKAVAKSFPSTPHQLCTVHLMRNFMSRVRSEDKKEIASDLSYVLSVNDKEHSIEEARKRFDLMREKWRSKYKGLSRYLSNFQIEPYLTYLNYNSRIRTMIYPTNWIERFNRSCRRTLKIRGAFPSESSVLGLLTSVAIEKSENHYAYPIYNFKFEPKLMKQPKT